METFKERIYRNAVSPGGLVSFKICEDETDLLISASVLLEEKARASAVRHRKAVSGYAREDAVFLSSLKPLAPRSGAPRIVKDMCAAAAACGVGPMAAVAGAIAEYVGRDLLEESGEVIVENGGDVFISSRSTRVAGIYAGDSVFSGRVGVEVAPGSAPLGICTSSGTFGHSLNFGSADAVAVISRSTALADAAATACSNLVKDAGSVNDAIGFARSVEGVSGIVVILGDTVGIWGDLQLREIFVEDNR